MNRRTRHSWCSSCAHWRPGKYHDAAGPILGSCALRPDAGLLRFDYGRMANIRGGRVISGCEDWAERRPWREEAMKHDEAAKVQRRMQ